MIYAAEWTAAALFLGFIGLVVIGALVFKAACVLEDAVTFIFTAGRKR